MSLPKTWSKLSDENRRAIYCLFFSVCAVRTKTLYTHLTRSHAQPRPAALPHSCRSRARPSCRSARRRARSSRHPASAAALGAAALLRPVVPLAAALSPPRMSTAPPRLRAIALAAVAPTRALCHRHTDAHAPPPFVAALGPAKRSSSLSPMSPPGSARDTQTRGNCRDGHKKVRY